jgi:hypothetical protein
VATGTGEDWGDARVIRDNEARSESARASTRQLPQPLPPDHSPMPTSRDDLRSLIATTLLYSAAIVAVVALMMVAIIVGVVMR